VSSTARIGRHGFGACRRGFGRDLEPESGRTHRNRPGLHLTKQPARSRVTRGSRGRPASGQRHRCCSSTGRSPTGRCS
jgi:hypothetical protein